MNHEEQKLQIKCVSRFRGEYPQYAMLLTHPINEGGRNTARTGGIHNAEETQAGVSDLLFFVPAEYRRPAPIDGLYLVTTYNGLGIEFKTAKGRQSKEQKEFQKMFEAAGYKYAIVRSYEEFQGVMNDYLAHVATWKRIEINAAYGEITKAAEQREKEKFYKVIGKK